MMPPIALHVGAHKTATTFTQSRLAEARALLGARGVAYFGPEQLRAGGNMTFPTPVMVDPVKIAKLRYKTQAQIVAAVDEALSNPVNRVLVSEENILGSSRLNLRRSVLYPALAARLSCLPDTWTNALTDIFLSIREYGAFYVSCQSTVAQLGDWVPLTPARQKALAGMERRWTDVAAELLERFPRARLHVWRYEDLHQVGPQIVRQMTGLDINVDFSQGRSMTALNGAAIKAIRAAWNAGGGKHLPPETIREIRKRTEGDPTPHHPLQRGPARRFAEVYAEDWEVLKSNPLVSAYGA